MYKELFNGYNCLSAALGEYSIRKKYNYITDVINSQLTFIFDEKPFGMMNGLQVQHWNHWINIF